MFNKKYYEGKIDELNRIIRYRDAKINELREVIKQHEARTNGERVCNHECTICRHVYYTPDIFGAKEHCKLNIQCKGFEEQEVII